MRCLTSARFTMQADILKPGDVVEDPIDLGDYGEFVDSQDPLTGEIVKHWVPFPDDPDTPGDDSVFGTINCLARGVVDGGIRSSGNTQQFGAEYANIENVRLWTPAWTKITKSDRVTNIRDRSGHIVFLDEEFAGVPRSTVYNVLGVTPVFDAFNQYVENYVALERAEVAT